MAQRGSQVLLVSKPSPSTKETSRVHLNSLMASKNRISLNLTPSKNDYISGMSQSQKSQTKRLSSADVGLITGLKFKEGQPIKGQSRISYIPYEKKVIDYETRTYTEMRPKTKKITDYQEKKVIEKVPRQVVRQQYYPVHRITQYCKQVVDVRPVEKKVKKLQYFPVEKKIVHYRQNEDYNMAQNQSKVHLQSQGNIIKYGIEYRTMRPNLNSEYTGTPSRINMQMESSNIGSHKFISRSPSFLTNNITSSKVQVFHPSLSSSKVHMDESRNIVQPEQSNSINEKSQNSTNSKSKLLQRYGSSGKLSAKNYL